MFAQGCGGDPATQVPNNVYGHGRIDVLAAYEYAAAPPVGGIAELPDVAGRRLETAGSSGSGVGFAAWVAAAVAAGVATLGGVAWRARRRWVT